MKTAKQRSVLIVEPDVQLREELYNFLLADGYKQVTATESLAAVLESIRHAAYDIILAAAAAPEAGGLQVAQDIAALSPTTTTILMINAEDPDAWQPFARQGTGVHFLIKKTFAHDVLYLLATAASCDCPYP
jgi:DNA-binding NtrC family response regulator